MTACSLFVLFVCVVHLQISSLANLQEKGGDEINISIVLKHNFACIFSDAAAESLPHLEEIGVTLIGSEQIVGGSDVSIEDFPFQLSFQQNGMHICGAAIISELWAITAAHCVNRTGEDVAKNFPINLPSNWSIINTIRKIRISFSVRAGSTFVGRGGTVHDVQTIIVHPKYHHLRHDNDIALLKISSPFNFRRAVRAIPLVSENEEPMAGDIASVTGWGLKAEKSRQPAGVLQQVSLTVVEEQTCVAAYGKITRSMLCAGDVAGGRDSCQGDSGGPLVVRRKLAGIVSFGKGCGRADYPGVYANVATLRQWIRNTTAALS